MKEDVLEQIVDDYLQFRGYFTTHNVRFRPRADHAEFVRSADSVASDVDVVGHHPQREGSDRVIVVTCKAWQAGFDATAKLAELRGEKANPKRATWHHFRELWIPRWSEAFRATITDLTGEATFTYRIAVTRLKGNAGAWATDPTIATNLAGCHVGFITLEEVWATMLGELTTTPASSEMGRLVQLLKAAGLTAAEALAPPSPPAPGATQQRRISLTQTRSGVRRRPSHLTTGRWHRRGRAARYISIAVSVKLLEERVRSRALDLLTTTTTAPREPPPANVPRSTLRVRRRRMELSTTTTAVTVGG